MMHSLSRSLRLSATTRLALVGGGGKTTAVFQIAREMVAAQGRTVVVTTTTHLAVSQATLATHHKIVTVPSDLDSLTHDMPAGILLLTGKEIESGRLGGLSLESTQRLREICDFHQLPLLIEADGSRRKPLKSPAEHEPAIPEFVDAVCVVAGLSALGNPLSSDWVHRVENFCAVTGEQEGKLIDVHMISRMLLHPEGGLKNIPSHARKIVLLNQVDSVHAKAQANSVSAHLLEAYDSVIIAALAPEQSGANDTERMIVTREPVAGVILAAGAGLRYGSPKQLLDWKGFPFVRVVANNALNAGLDPVVVVFGAYRDKVEESVKDLPVVLAFNPEWETGQGSSIRAGMQYIPRSTGAAIFLLVDQPQIGANVLRALVDHHAITMSEVLAPMVLDRRANPVLFDQDTFESLRDLKNHESGKNLFSKFRLEYMPWYDDLLLLDVDTPDDYNRLVEAA